jgi:BirA family biotin operon repressor/biotin-[acetyl-CoA-carboxylase] ligase
MKRITLETVDSTNNYIKEQPAPEGQEWLVVTTEFQTSGRGSASNSWESEKGRNLLFSIRFPEKRTYTADDHRGIRRGIVLYDETVQTGKKILPR